MKVERSPSCKEACIQLSASAALRSGSADWPISSAGKLPTLKNRFLCERAKDDALRGTMSAMLFDITTFAY